MKTSWLLPALALALGAPHAGAKTFGPDSIVVPMDHVLQGTNGAGLFKAYGLVFKLLQAGIPVDWVIRPGKPYGGSDFTASTRPFGGSGAGTSRSYAGGPFVVDAADRAAATPIVQAWLAANPQVAVHEATSSFDGDVGRSLVAAPRLAVLIDGFECIAFGYLNAAGIPDSRGQPWPGACASSYPGYVDILSETAVAGPTTSSHRDGALFESGGVPRYCHIMAMHYPEAAGTQDEVVQEVGEFLRSRNMLIAECEAANIFEDKGLFLTTGGMVKGGLRNGDPVVHAFADHPVAQSTGTFAAQGGSMPRWDPIGAYRGAEGTEYFRIVRQQKAADLDDVVVLGHAFGDTSSGRVTYLGGHNYSTDPTSDASRGMRNFLNALLFSPCTGAGDGVASVSIALAGPASPTSNPAMDFTVTYRNEGTGVAWETVITVPIPAGTTASMVSGGGTVMGNEIVWNLGTLDAGRPSPAGALSFRLTAAAEGSYTVTATATYKRGLTPATTQSTLTISYGVTAAPVVDAPIDAGATSVSGTSSEADGSTVEVFVGRGSGFTSAGTTTVAGGAWSLGGLTPLLGGEMVKARATAAGKVTSVDSNVVTVTSAGRTAQPSVDGPLVEGATALSGVTPDGGVVEAFVDGASVGFAVVNGTAWAISGLTPLTAGQVVTAVATATPLLPSAPSAPQTVLARTGVPSVTAPLAEGAVSVSGTAPEDGTIEVFVNGVSAGTTTASAGAWTLALPPLAAGDAVTVRATASGKAPSDLSAPVTVLARTATPSLGGPLVPGATAVSGASPEDGTIEVFVNGMSAGTTAASGGAWTLSGIAPLAAGDVVTAVATAPGKAPSLASEPVTVPAMTDRPTVAVPITRGDTVVSGGITEADGTSVEVLVNGVPVGTTSASGGLWVLNLQAPLQVSQEVRARATAPGEAPSQLSLPAIVRDVSERPSVASPILAGATTVRGASSEADGTVIEVYVDQNLAGTAVVAGGAWSFALASPLAADQVVEAKALAPGEARSAFSNAVVVAEGEESISETPSLSLPIFASATQVSGTTSEADGTVVEVFVDGVPVAIATASGGAWSVSGLAPLAGGQLVHATATAPGKGTSAPSAAVAVQGTALPPAVLSPILAGATTVSGRSAEPSAQIEILVNGAVAGTSTVVGGAWTLSGLPPLAAGDQVTARAVVPGKATSPTGNVVTVSADAAGQSAPPAIASVAEGATSVSGTSTEPDGTVVQLFVNGAPAGTAIVGGGAWSVTGLPPLVVGSELTATATAPGKGTSALSQGVVVGAVSAAPTVSGPILAGATAVAGSSTEADGTRIDVYVDGAAAGTATVSGGAWSAPVPRLSAGQRVSARATAPGEVQSPFGNEVVVSSGVGGLTSTPSITGPLVEGDRSVAGTSSEPDGTLVEVFVSGALAGRATVVAGTWSANVPPLGAGGEVTAIATADGKGASLPSPPVTVLSRTARPSIDAPIAAGATQVSGTSSEPAGTTVAVYVNSVLAGTATVGAGGSWVLPGLTPLAEGDVVTATATASGKGTSAPGNTVIVSAPGGARSDPPVLSGPLLAGDTQVSGQSSEAPGTRIDVFVNRAFVGSAVVDASGSWAISGLPPLPAGATVTATATAPGEGTSAPSAALTVMTRTAAPAILGSIAEGSTEVRGTSSEPAGTTIVVYVDGAPVATTTVQADGTWVATVPPLLAGSSVTAVATASGKAPSRPAEPSVVLQKTRPPLVQEGLVEGDTLVRGTVPDDDALVTVLVNGAAVASVAATGSQWAAPGLTPLREGDAVSARARIPGRALSDPSNVVIVLGRTARPVVSAPLVEGDTAIAGMSPAGGRVEILVNGASVGTAETLGTAFSLAGLAPLVVGQSVTAVATASPRAPSLPSDPVIVVRRTARPEVDGPLGAGDTRVSGTSGEPDGTVVTVFVDGIPVASATVEGGFWSAQVPPLAAGARVTAKAQAPGAGRSQPSDAVTVLRRTRAPTVDPVPAGATRVTGRSDEPPGTTIDVYVDGEKVGTATVQADGTWSLDVPALELGQRITVVATAQGAAPSTPREPVVVGTPAPPGGDGGAGIGVSGGGCLCNAAPGAPASWGWVLLYAVVLAWRRLRRED